jgi:hypothetical protein
VDLRLWLTASTSGWACCTPAPSAGASPPPRPLAASQELLSSPLPKLPAPHCACCWGDLGPGGRAYAPRTARSLSGEGAKVPRG